MSKLPVAFADEPESHFPLVLIFYLAATGKEVHRIEVDGPGAIFVPPLAKEHGGRIALRIEYANGEIDAR